MKVYEYNLMEGDVVKLRYSQKCCNECMLL
jgi:hypothetical protein